MLPGQKTSSEVRLRHSQDPRLIRSERYVFLLCAIAVLFSGLASRRFRRALPAFLDEFAGDTLWALMLFLLVSTVLARRPILVRAAISLALAFLVEISQLYHAPWIDGIRNTTLGGLVLGFGFLWTDLICYAVGIIAVALMERSVLFAANRVKLKCSNIS